MILGNPENPKVCSCPHMEEFEEALVSSRYAGGVLGGRSPPHRPNRSERARRPKADEEGQGAEGTSEAEGRREGQQGQRPNPEMDPKVRFWNKDDHEIDKVLTICPEHGSVHTNFFVRIKL